MREKIAELLCIVGDFEIVEGADIKADQILTLIHEEIEEALLSKENLTQINNAMPSDAKYGEVFMAIAQAQLQKILALLEGKEGANE